MATTTEVALGDHVAWTDIEPDGTEIERTGRVWSLAGPVTGMRSWWVLPEPALSGPVRVAQASRRHPGGRVHRVQVRAVTGELAVVERWLPAGGRVIDKGEWFRETHPASRFATREPVPPTHAVPRKRTHAASATDLRSFAAICEAVAVGANVDLTVDAADVAAEAERSERRGER